MLASCVAKKSRSCMSVRCLQEDGVLRVHLSRRGREAGGTVCVSASVSVYVKDAWGSEGFLSSINSDFTY